jgi:hypothetical protein
LSFVCGQDERVVMSREGGREDVRVARFSI